MLMLNLDTENYRIGYFEHGNRHIRRAFGAREVGAVAEVILDAALIYAYVTLASVKNDLLLYDSDSLKFLRIALAYASLKTKLDVDAHTYLVKTAVEVNRINRNVSIHDTCALCSDGGGMLNYLTSEVGEINDCILIAVLVSARIEYAIGIDTYRLTWDRGTCTITSDIRH